MIRLFNVNIRYDDRSLSSRRSLAFDIVNDARDIDRAILRVIATARTAGRAAGTTEGFSFYHRRRPENLDIAIRAARRLARAAIKLFLMIAHLSLGLGVFHDLSCCDSCSSASRPLVFDGVLAFSLLPILPQALLE